MQELTDDERVALVDLARRVFVDNEPLHLDGFIIKDTETDRRFVVNLDIREVGVMTAGLKGTSKVN